MSADSQSVFIVCFVLLTTLALVRAKMAGIISFGWWWVFSPVWGVAGLLLAIVAAYALWDEF